MCICLNQLLGKLLFILRFAVYCSNKLSLACLDDQGRSISSRNQSSGRDRERSSQQSISRRSSGSIGPRRHDRDGTAKSRGYASFGRSNRDRGGEKDSESRNWESRLGPPDDPLYDGFKPFSSFRPERDSLNHTRLMVDTLNQAG